MKSGIELITIERQEQIEKHGRTIDLDILTNPIGQLSYAVGSLVHEYDCEGGNIREWGPDLAELMCPAGWDKVIWMKMQGKPYKERLIIAGALIAAEIDRLNALTTLTN